jgi:hypothetical protein
MKKEGIPEVLSEELRNKLCWNSWVFGSDIYSWNSKRINIAKKPEDPVSSPTYFTRAYFLGALVK